MRQRFALGNVGGMDFFGKADGGAARLAAGAAEVTVGGRAC